MLPVRVQRLAWGTLVYTVLVILWGAFVRASGSGAGCGDHWPLCNGQVIPQSPTWQTVVEFTHRITSGLALPLVLVLAVAVWRSTRPGAAVRRAAVLSVALMVVEGALGAALVLFEYVAYNPSIGRAYWMAAHLVNTLFLMAALTATAWWARGGAVPRLRADRPTGALAAMLVGTLVLSAGGAVTALGDTLVLGGGLDPETDPIVGTLVGLRIYHPLMAFVVLGLVGLAVRATHRLGESARRRGRLALGLYSVQMALGALNVWLMAPVWMQIVHLLMTNVIWVVMLVWVFEALGQRAEPETVPSPAVPRERSVPSARVAEPA